MTCETVRLPGGGTAIVCTRGPRRKPPRCAYCERPARYQCDQVLRQNGWVAQTCDRWLCEEHRHPVSRNVDHCPDHARQGRMVFDLQPVLEG